MSDPKIVDHFDAFEAVSISFDGVAAIGRFNDTLCVTLAATRFVPAPGGTAKMQHTVVGYLRGNISAMAALRKQIDRLLLLATDVQGGTN